MRATLLAFLLACGPTELDPGPPEIVNVDLEVGRTHQPYVSWLAANGGTEPLLWTIEGELPNGIALNPAGALTGVATESWSDEVTLTVTDDEGRSDSSTLPLEIKWSKGTVACGDSDSGEFTEGASAGWNELDWDATDGWVILEIPLPDPEVTRIEINVEDNYFDLYLAKPGTPEGDQNLSANYHVVFAGPGTPLVIDLGTIPDLESYRAYDEPIQLLITTVSPANWSVEVACTEGPIIVAGDPDPTLLGEPLNVNYSVHGKQASVTWSVQGEMPTWASFDAESGRILGFAEEPGTWPLTVVATDEQGRSDSVSSGFGVYEHVPTACDTEMTWAGPGFFFGTPSDLSNPEGYRVFELPIDRSLSGVTAWFDATEAGQMGVVRPGSPTYLTSPEIAYTPELLSVRVGPDTWPPMAAHADLGAMYAVAALWFGDAEPRFWFECDPLPRPDLFALPVLEPGASEVRQLDAIGGTGPYTWSAANLPAGVSLDPTGVLSSNSPMDGTTSVELTVVDSYGAQSSTSLDLHVGEVAACQGATPVACGEVYTSSELLAETTETLCVERAAADEALVVFTLLPVTASRLDGYLGNPGTGPSDISQWLVAPRSGLPDARSVDDTTSPPLWAYQDLPMFFTVVADNGGSYELAVDCVSP